MRLEPRARSVPTKAKCGLVGIMPVLAGLADNRDNGTNPGTRQVSVFTIYILLFVPLSHCPRRSNNVQNKKYYFQRRPDFSMSVRDKASRFSRFSQCNHAPTACPGAKKQSGTNFFCPGKTALIRASRDACYY